MPSAFQAGKEIFSATIKADMLILTVVLYAAMIAVSVVVVLLAIILGVIAFALLFAAPIIGIVLLAVLFALFMVFILITVAIQEAMLVKGAKDALEGRKFTIMEVFNSVKQKWKPLAGITLIKGLFFLLVFFVFMLPAVFTALNYLQNPPFTLEEINAFKPDMKMDYYTPFFSFLFERTQGLVLAVFAGLAAFSVVSFLVSPFTLLMVPLAVFENCNAVQAVRKGILLGAKNYFFTLKVLFVFFLIMWFFYMLIYGGVFLLGVTANEVGGIVSLYFSLLFSVAAAKIYLLNSQ